MFLHMVSKILLVHVCVKKKVFFLFFFFGLSFKVSMFLFPSKYFAQTIEELIFHIDDEALFFPLSLLRGHDSSTDWNNSQFQI